jgi:hypothetical protein
VKGLAEVFQTFIEGETRYRIAWSVYNNKDDSTKPLKGPFTQHEMRVELPETPYYHTRKDLYLLAEIFSE